jgi:hypothetical protein
VDCEVHDMGEVQLESSPDQLEEPGWTS